MNPIPKRNLLIVLSAPSGAGKTTLGERILAELPGLCRIITCTTRAPRAGEIHDQDYHFLAQDEFERRLAKGDFLEHASVHGNLYGTLRQSVLDTIAAGHDALLIIDVQGAAQVRNMVTGPKTNPFLQDSFLDIFITPPGSEELRKRLVGRGTDSIDVIERRLSNAGLEMERWPEFRYVVLNDSLDSAVENLTAIIRAEHCRNPRTQTDTAAIAPGRKS